MFLSQFFTNPLLAIIFIGILIIVISVHEYAHARVAHELGDPTAELAGRLTLNPRAHLDPMGSLMFLLFGFGWGKPVPVDPYNLRNPVKDGALISLAGPASNGIVALGTSVVLYTAQFAGLKLGIIVDIASLFIQMNLVLGMFNLLPFAPLDGYAIVGGLLPKDKLDEWRSLERYGILFLFLFIIPFVGNRSMLEIFVMPVISFVTQILIP